MTHEPRPIPVTTEKALQVLKESIDAEIFVEGCVTDSPSQRLKKLWKLRDATALLKKAYEELSRA